MLGISEESSAYLVDGCQTGGHIDAEIEIGDD
jgi:hypothetical protein